MTTKATAGLGLRERKRLATRRAIQVAVLGLVRDHGLDGLTVDDISRVADVSPRTFFNYFASKEEALVGDPLELPAQELVDEFVMAGGDSLLDDLKTLMIGAGEKSVADAEMLTLRHSILKQHPQLFAMRMVTMRAFEDELAAVVRRRLLQDDPSLEHDREVLSNRARLVTLVAFAAMRHAWTCWATQDGSSLLSERLTESFAELRTLFTPTLA